MVGDDEQIAEDLEPLPDRFAWHEHGREFLLHLGDIDLRGVSKRAAEESHDFVAALSVKKSQGAVSNLILW